MPKTIGHAAYSKWVELLPPPTIMPRWENLPASAQAGWEEIATAAVEQQMAKEIAILNQRLDAQIGESDG